MNNNICYKETQSTILEKIVWQIRSYSHMATYKILGKIVLSYYYTYFQLNILT